MPLPFEIARQLTEEQIAFVKRCGLKAEILEPGHVRLCMPLAGNQNHIGSMYAGALFTLAEIPGGALFVTSFDTQRFYPVIKEMNLRFRRPATGNIRVDATLSAETIERLQDEAARHGKADYPLTLELTSESGEVVAQSIGLYQLRSQQPPARAPQVERPPSDG
ncbi:YiiD C-terminal domain-containing protein [Pseudomonas borbori]